MVEKTGPCIEKNCSECCDPIKVPRPFPAEEVPKDSEGNQLWTKRDTTLRPEDQEHMKLDAYDCKNFDPSTGKCKDYENRPDICKNSGCVDSSSPMSAEEQYQEMKKKKILGT